MLIATISGAFLGGYKTEGACATPHQPRLTNHAIFNWFRRDQKSLPASESQRTAPILIGHKTHVSRAHFSAIRAHKSTKSRASPRLSPQLLHRVIHTVHNAPVDITVDKGTPPISEKAQQNQHFKYHSLARSSYYPVNKSLTALWKSKPTPPQPAAPIVTPVWNMHRSRAACSLNVTSMGICLSSQHYVITAISHFSPQTLPPPLTRPVCGTIVKPTFGILAAHEPRLFPGNS